MVYLLLDNIEYSFIFFFCFKIAELFSFYNIIHAFGIYIEEYKAFLFWLNFFSHISLLLLLSFDISIKEKKEETLNKDAKEFIPTKNRKLKLNENAKEYIPKDKRENKKEIKIEYVEGDDEDEEEQIKDKIDIMMRDEIENEVMNELAKEGNIDDDSEDEDKWLPKYKDCECCHGFVYKCAGESCKNLGQCYCKMKDEVEGNDDEADNNK